jgi:AcrR family transcriptional regulator
VSVVTDGSSHGPVTRGHKKRERTRRLLIDAAVEVIAHKGETFTFSDISAQAGVASGTIYNYFSTRDELIDAVVPQVLGAFGAESAAAFPDTDPVTRFATITALALRRAEVAPEEMSVLLRLDRVQRAVVNSDVLAHLRADLAAGADTGRFHGTIDDATVDVVIGALFFSARRIIDGPVGDGYRTRVVAQLLRSLGLQPAHAEALAAEAVATADTIRPPDDNG